MRRATLALKAIFNKIDQMQKTQIERVGAESMDFLSLLLLLELPLRQYFYLACLVLIHTMVSNPEILALVALVIAAATEMIRTQASRLYQPCRSVRSSLIMVQDCTQHKMPIDSTYHLGAHQSQL